MCRGYDDFGASMYRQKDFVRGSPSGAVFALAHATTSRLPLSLDESMATIAAGVVVLLVVAHDYYRRRSSGVQ